MVLLSRWLWGCGLVVSGSWWAVRDTNQVVFVRKVRTGSRATAVQVVQKRHGKPEVIEHLGSGHSPVEVALLVHRGARSSRASKEFSTWAWSPGPIPDWFTPQRDRPL